MAKKKFSVLVPFRSKEDKGKEYKRGDDVSDFDQDRLDALVERKLVKQEEAKPETSGNGGETAAQKKAREKQEADAEKKRLADEAEAERVEQARLKEETDAKQKEEAEAKAKAEAEGNGGNA